VADGRAGGLLSLHSSTGQQPSLDSFGIGIHRFRGLLLTGTTYSIQSVPDVYIIILVRVFRLFAFGTVI
jgi:hypothetical protein